MSARADWNGGNGGGGALQRIKGILPELGAGCEVADEKADGVAAEGVLQDAGEFRVAVRDTALRKTRMRRAKDALCREIRTAPWLRAWTTWPSTLSDLLIAADSAMREESLPVSYASSVTRTRWNLKVVQTLLFSEPARSTRLSLPERATHFVNIAWGQIRNRARLLRFCKGSVTVTWRVKMA